MKKLRITVDGKVFDVQVEDVVDSNSGSMPGHPRVLSGPSSAPVSAPRVAAPAAASSRGGPGDVVSPLAGRVVSVDCKVGDKVDAGAQLVTIEAMKMNTFVNAGAAGTVSAVHVNAGDAVEEGQPLVRVQ